MRAAQELTDEEKPEPINEFGYAESALDTEEDFNGDYAENEYLTDLDDALQTQAGTYMENIVPPRKMDDYMRRQAWIGYKGLNEDQIMQGLWSRCYAYPVDEVADN